MKYLMSERFINTQIGYQYTIICFLQIYINTNIIQINESCTDMSLQEIIFILSDFSVSLIMLCLYFPLPSTIQ